MSLPWHWLEEHQLLSSILPDRLSILADGAAAVLLAVGIDEVAGRLAARRRLRARRPPGERWSGARPWCWRSPCSPACRCCPDRSRPGRRRRCPHGWSATFTALHLPPGAPVLVVPVPTNILTAAMRWQADTGQPAALVGGYFIGPGAGGQAYIGGNGVSPTAWYLDQLWAAGLSPASTFAGAALAAGLPVATPGRAGLGAQGARAVAGAGRPGGLASGRGRGRDRGQLAAGQLPGRRCSARRRSQSGTVIAWRR